MAEYRNRTPDELIKQATDSKQPTEYQSRANDTKSDASDIPISITLMTIDETLIKYLTTRIEPILTQDGKSVKIPVIYGNPERWKSVQKDGILRDKFNKIQLPIIMLRRTSMKKSKLNSSVNKYLEQDFESRGWNKYNPYDRFAAVNGIRPVKQLVATVTPDYFDLTYECIIWTEYVEQMNKVVEQISFEDDEYWGERGQYKFYTNISEYKMDTVLPNVQDRLVRTTFTLKVNAYLLPEKMLDKYNKVMRTTQQRFSTKKIVTFTEVEEG